MKFYAKLVLHLFDNEINELLAKMQSHVRFSIFSNNQLIDSLMNATTAFKEKLRVILQNDQESDDTIYNSLSDLLTAFQHKMDDIRAEYGVRHVNYVAKLTLLQNIIRDECIKASVWELKYDDSEPSCLFQYPMLAYLIRRYHNGQFDPDIIDIIKEELRVIQEYYQDDYAASPSISTKFHFIHSCLCRMARARNELLRNQPVISFMGVPMENVMTSIDIALSQLEVRLGIPPERTFFSGGGDVTYVPVTHRPAIRKEYAAVMKSDSSPASSRLTSQERYDALESTAALEAVGYKKAALNKAWLCGITLDIADDPVLSGSTYKGIYERIDLEKWVCQSGTDPNTRETITLDQIKPLPLVKEEINQFLSEQEAIKKYFEQCVERGFETKDESMAVVLYRP